MYKGSEKNSSERKLRTKMLIDCGRNKGTVERGIRQRLIPSRKDKISKCYYEQNCCKNHCKDS